MDKFEKFVTLPYYDAVSHLVPGTVLVTSILLWHPARQAFDSITDDTILAVLLLMFIAYLAGHLLRVIGSSLVNITWRIRHIPYFYNRNDKIGAYSIKKQVKDKLAVQLGAKYGLRIEHGKWQGWQLSEIINPYLDSIPNTNSAEEARDRRNNVFPVSENIFYSLAALLGFEAFNISLLLIRYQDNLRWYAVVAAFLTSIILMTICTHVAETNRDMKNRENNMMALIELSRSSKPNSQGQQK